MKKKQFPRKAIFILHVDVFLKFDGCVGLNNVPPKMFTPEFLELVNVTLCYYLIPSMGLVKNLGFGGYPGGLNFITSVLIRGIQEGQTGGNVMREAETGVMQP